MEGKEKIYIDFIAPHGSGKTTIKNKLHYLLKEEGEEVCDMIKIMPHINSLKNILFFSLFYPKKTLSILLYWQKYKQYGRDNKINFGRKEVIIRNLILEKSIKKYFLDESFIHREIKNCAFPSRILLNFLPSTNAFFVFIDTLPSISFQRRIMRGDKHVNLSSQIKHYRNSKKYFSFLKNKKKL